MLEGLAAGAFGFPTAPVEPEATSRVVEPLGRGCRPLLCKYSMISFVTALSGIMTKERVAFSHLFTEAIDFVDRVADVASASANPKSLLEVALQENSVGSATGDERLASIRAMLNWLDDHGHERSPQQRELQEAFLQATVKIIYRDEFVDNVERIMRNNGWTKLFQEVLIGTPRRFGKTYSTSEFACVFIIANPNAKVCIYSTGKSTAAMVLDHIRTFFRELPCFSEFDIIIDNEKVLQIAPRNNPTDRRIVKSFTSNPKISIFPFVFKGGTILGIDRHHVALNKLTILFPISLRTCKL